MPNSTINALPSAIIRRMRALFVAVVIAVHVVAAPARAQTANVTLYGRLNLDMEVVNGKQGGAACPDNCPNPNQYRVSSNSSMFGIRGVEPLGDGLNAIFQVESRLFMDTGGGILAGRESFLGLQGIGAPPSSVIFFRPTTTFSRSSATRRR